MKRTLKGATVIIAIVVLILSVSSDYPQTVGSPQKAEISPGTGLKFFQLDLTFPGAIQMDSPYGLATVDFATMTTSTGISWGFLSILTEDGWVIRNMPVYPLSEYPGMSVMFDLGTTDEGTTGEYDVTDLLAYAVFSSVPTVEFAGEPTTHFDVEPLAYNAQGIDGVRTSIPSISVDTSVINFQVDRQTSLAWQLGHPNIEQDVNQCGPAAVANCFQWQEDCYDINIPHEHRAGTYDDGSLVGQLDIEMKRGLLGVSIQNFLDGKSNYIKKNYLSDDLVMETRYRSATLADWIIEELADGENVELIILWDGGGGHAINLIGGGYILGVPWIAWVHDVNQGEEGGTKWLDGGKGFSFIVDNKIVCFIGTATIEVAISESPKEEKKSLCVIPPKIIPPPKILEKIPIAHDPPIYRNIMVFPTPERFLGSDLNGDGDTNDIILRYQNLKTGDVINTGLIASGAYHSMDIYENIIAFIGKDSRICYYDINTGTVGDAGITGIDPSIHSNIIAFASKGTICYFDLSTQVLVNTKLSGHSPSIYQNLIVFCASPKRTIWVYDLSTGTTTDTGVIGWNPTFYRTRFAFSTSESAAAQDLNGDGDTKDFVIRYYDFETQAITNTGVVGIFPALYENRIVFTTPEEDVNQDLNGDGRILGNVIRYYDLKTGQVVNTRKLGTEPDIYEDTITFYAWEQWTGRDLSGDRDLSDPIVDTYQIAMTEMSIVGPETWLFLALLVIGSITAYFKRKK